MGFHWYCKEQLVKKPLKFSWKSVMLESSIFGQDFRNAACLHKSLQKKGSDIHMHVCILFAIDDIKIYTDILERCDDKNNNVYHIQCNTCIY